MDVTETIADLLAEYKTGIEGEPVFIEGWVLVCASRTASDYDDGVTGYKQFTPAGQAVHTTIGLLSTGLADRHNGLRR